MTLRTLSLALALVALLGAVPVRAQDGVPFPGIAWGVSADSVIRVWGEPSSRAIEHGVVVLAYEGSWNGHAATRYAAVHPSMGTMLAGYRAPFASPGECRLQAASALEQAVRHYPRLVWAESSRPDATAVCDGTAGPSGALGQDPESGTRIGIHLDAAATTLVADAASAEGFEWVHRQQRGASASIRSSPEIRTKGGMSAVRRLHPGPQAGACGEDAAQLLRSP